jgi:tRNA-(ms[2]io[6]A)-hydroxylase
MGASSGWTTEAADFLLCPTPDAWFEQAPEHLTELLIDHANCEKKAAGTALSLLYRYVDKPDVLDALSRLAREELTHFDQVRSQLARLGIAYEHLSSSRYAGGLRDLIRAHEPARLVDTLLTGAIVEARSCERFVGLAAVLPAELAGFYERLAVAEARHFRSYLELAERHGRDLVAERLPVLLARDAELVSDADEIFRFHSGPLASAS